MTVWARNVPSRRCPGPVPRGSPFTFRSTTPAAARHRARRAASTSASASRSASSISSPQNASNKHTMNPQRHRFTPWTRGALRMAAGAAWPDPRCPRVRARRRRSPDTGSGSRTSTANSSPGSPPPRHHLPTLRRRRWHILDTLARVSRLVRRSRAPPSRFGLLTGNIHPSGSTPKRPRSGGRRRPRARLASASVNTRRAYAGALRRLDGRELHDVTLAAYGAELHDAGRASSSASMARSPQRASARTRGPAESGR